MTNQRPARVSKPIGNPTVTLSQLLAFSKEAARLLQNQGDDDAAFYFEQLAEHIQSNPEKGLSESVSRILGL
jgi:hypothetical protein